MCSRGVYQLKKISLQFCDQGGRLIQRSLNIIKIFQFIQGSSKGIREFLQSDLVKEFMVKNPQIKFDFIMKRNKHPFFTAQYINGYNKDISLKNFANDEILKEFERVRTSSKSCFSEYSQINEPLSYHKNLINFQKYIVGRQALPFAGKKIYTTRPSIQGKWTPLTWNTYPRVEMQMIREIKEPTERVQLVDNVNKGVELINYKDFVHIFLKEKRANEERINQSQ